MANMKLIGPFTSLRNTCLLGIEPENIIILKLNLLSNIKYGLSLQTGFYSSHISNLLLKSKDELKNRFQYFEYSRNQVKSIRIDRNKYWSHKVIIELESKEFKFFIQERYKVDKYENVVNKWMNKE